MLIKNYNIQNHFNLDDGTYIKGVIEMTYAELCEVYDFLMKEHKKAEKKIETYKRDAYSNFH